MSCQRCVEVAVELVATAGWARRGFWGGATHHIVLLGNDCAGYQVRNAVDVGASNWVLDAGGCWGETMGRGEEQKSGVDCFSL